MPRIARELTVAQVKAIKPSAKARGYPVGGLPGLLLWVKPSGSRSWILRTTIHGRRLDIGLGPFPTVNLADARDAGRLIVVRYKTEGTDPLAERQTKRVAAAALVSRPTFTDAVKRYLERKSDEWSNPKHAAQWKATLATYAEPIIGKKPIAEIDRVDIQRVLDPIWDSKRETASRVRGRIESVLSFAAVQGWRSSENPARWKGALDQVYSTKRTVQHQPALPWKRIAQFMSAVRSSDAVSARALEFVILTCTRVGMVIGARWQEIDLESKSWTVPAARMKSRVEFRVALSDAAISLLKEIPFVDLTTLIFQAPRGGQLSDMTLTKFVRDSHERLAGAGHLGWVDPKADGRIVVVHGFRSTFRDWVSDTGKPPHLAEQALAHVIGDKVERAYNRTDSFDLRLKLMNEWAAACTSFA